MVPEEVQAVIQTLESLGFLVNREKSSLFPSQIIQYFGFKINLVTMILFLPQGKLSNLIREVSELYIIAILAQLDNCWRHWFNCILFSRR